MMLYGSGVFHPWHLSAWWGEKRGYPLPITFQHLIYPADCLNRTTVLALLHTLSRELRALVEHPDGTKDKPAATCKELLLAHPNLPDGTGLPCGPSQGTRRGGDRYPL